MSYSWLVMRCLEDQATPEIRVPEARQLRRGSIEEEVKTSSFLVITSHIENQVRYCDHGRIDRLGHTAFAIIWAWLSIGNTITVTLNGSETSDTSNSAAMKGGDELDR